MTNTESITMERQGVIDLAARRSVDDYLVANTNISGLPMRVVHLRLKLTLLKIAVKTYSNPLDWIRALQYLVRLRKRFLGNHTLQKMVYANGKYYMGLYTPGWNSSVYETFIASQLHDFKKTITKVNRFNTVFVAVTKKCPLQCDHCYEWENLNKKDILTTDRLKQMVKKLQDYGVSQIQFSGGEPLLKIESLIEVLVSSNKSTDFWITTSGHKLTQSNAFRLKQAGLTGVIISLDHFIPEKHNTFRGYNEAYYWVVEAVKNANRNNLVVALSVCVTRDFISDHNLMSYMELAKNLGVSFVQFLEPKAVGHFANKEVHLHQDQMELLENFYLKLNFNSAFNSYPIITYHGYYQRRQGCFSAGIKGMYIDTDGDMNACPFCHKKTGNVLDDCFEDHVSTLERAGCSSYN